MTVKIRAREAVEKYSDCIFKIVDMLFDNIQKDISIEESKDRKYQTNEPEINEGNQFQMLHLFALFGLNDKKKRLTEFIQSNINPKNLFNYLL